MNTNVPSQDPRSSTNAKTATTITTTTSSSSSSSHGLRNAGHGSSTTASGGSKSSGSAKARTTATGSRALHGMSGSSLAAAEGRSSTTSSSRAPQAPIDRVSFEVCLDPSGNKVARVSDPAQSDWLAHMLPPNARRNRSTTADDRQQRDQHNGMGGDICTFDEVTAALVEHNRQRDMMGDVTPAAGQGTPAAGGFALTPSNSRAPPPRNDRRVTIKVGLDPSGELTGTVTDLGAFADVLPQNTRDSMRGRDVTCEEMAATLFSLGLMDRNGVPTSGRAAAAGHTGQGASSTQPTPASSSSSRPAASNLGGRQAAAAQQAATVSDTAAVSGEGSGGGSATGAATGGHAAAVPPGGKQPRPCAMCGQLFTKLQHCARCKQALYCSREHQVAHWKLVHKFECKEQPSK